MSKNQSYRFAQAGAAAACVNVNPVALRTLNAVRDGAASLATLPGWGEVRNASVLITGAAGMIGSWLALAFLAADQLHGLGVKVYGLSRKMERAADLYAGLPLWPISLDVADDLGALARFDYIIHAASPVGPSLFDSQPFDVAAANLAGTVNLLRKAVRDQAKRFLFISTHEVYGQGKAIWREEDAGTLDFLSSRACYPESKRAGENVCISCHQQYGLHTNIARLSRVYGPGMNLDSGLFICDFFKDVLAGRPITIKGDGKLLRPLCHISDTVVGIIRILFSGAGGKAYNIAPDHPATILETAYTLASLAGTSVVEAGKSGSGGGAVQDASSLQALGWRPQISLEEGLAATLAYLKG